MRIGGVQKVSGIDFPGKLAAVIFTRGCNFRCQFCHNERLVLPIRFQKSLDEDSVFNFLKSRIGKIDGVVVSGGEPTLFHDLDALLKKIKDLGFLVKLDTNGSHPNMLEKLYNEKLVDYVAMDVKHEFRKYSDIIGVKANTSKIKKSIEIIKTSGVDYEFRTTVIPHFHSPLSIKKIAMQLSKAKKYVLQEFNMAHSLNINLDNENSIFAPENRQVLHDVIDFCKKEIEIVETRPL